MNSLKPFSRNLISLLRSDRTAEIPAFLGNLSGTVPADDAGNVYVTLVNGEVLTVYNGKVPNVSRLPVIVGYGGGNKLQVLRSRDVYVTPPYPDMPGHGSLHTFPGPDTVPVRGEQIVPGLVVPAGSLTVKVYSLAYELSDGWHILPTQEVDLTSNVPASGAIFALLEADNTGAIGVVEGAGVASRAMLEYSDIPAATADHYPVAAVKLYFGQTSILQTVIDSDIIDLRWGRAARLATEIHGATEDTAPEDADEFGFWDSVTGLLNRITWANIKATLKTYFDALYQTLDSDLTAIAALSPSDDDIIQRKSGAWTNRTLAQLATDMTELIQDIIGAMLTGNTETGISVTYEDSDGTIDFVVTGGAGAYSSVSSQSVTTGNVSAAEGTFYVLDVSGLTADRDFTLPTPSAAGKFIGLRIDTGDDTYELIIKRNGAEVTRVFISGETLEFVSTGTGAGDWVIEHDGRKAAGGRISNSAAQTINHTTATKIVFNTQDDNTNGMADITNDVILIRRAGRYAVSGAVQMDSGVIYTRILGNMTKNAGVEIARFETDSASTGIYPALSFVSVNFTFAAGDTIDMNIYHANSGAANKDTVAATAHLEAVEVL